MNLKTTVLIGLAAALTLVTAACGTTSYDSLNGELPLRYQNADRSIGVTTVDVRPGVTEFQTLTDAHVPDGFNNGNNEVWTTLADSFHAPLDPAVPDGAVLLDDFVAVYAPTGADEFWFVTPEQADQFDLRLTDTVVQ